MPSSNKDLFLSKTNYIIWRNCHKNAWLKIHKPEIYFAQELSEFEKQIIEAGNEVDILARILFPNGEYQKEFRKDGFLAVTDIILHIGRTYVELYEVKATNDIDKKVHLYDLSFQYNVLKMCGEKAESAHLIHLNPEYKRQGELDLSQLFKIENLTEEIQEMSEEVMDDMRLALDYLSQENEPTGPCDCLYKGRSAHCTTFHYSNPDIPEYGVHDLTRIGLSKRKLTELVDGHKFRLEEIPDGFELSDTQKNQIWTYLNDREIISKENIAEELETLIFPLYFLDYETFPAAIPRFDGFSPYHHIPFQYSLHTLDNPDSEPRHLEFLHIDNSDPSLDFSKSLEKNIGNQGSIIVWHKDFECGRNRELGERLPEFKNFFNDINGRIYDLETIFKKQHHVHKDYKGSSSIKQILPVLVPSLKYDDLEIKEGGTAAEKWNRLTTTELDNEEKEFITENLKAYCKLDTYAMYAIWKKLYKLIS